MSRKGLLVLSLGCLALLWLLWRASLHSRPPQTPNLVGIPGLSTRGGPGPSEPVPPTAAQERGAAESPTGPYFEDITDRAGIDFVQHVGPLGTYFMPEVNGSGGALFDYDGDGDLDLYLVNAGRSPEATADFPAGTRSENRLFRQDENLTFTDVTAESGLGDTGYGIGCAVADVDNDGDLDVYLTNYGPDRMYVNQGDGTFRDLSDEIGIVNDLWGTGAAFFDYDRDGLLDLFVVNYTADPHFGHSVACGFTPQNVSYCSPRKFLPTVDRLFHNETHTAEDGSTVVRFRDVTEESGIAGGLTNGFAAICADFNRDGWPDVFVASDMLPNRLWINQQDGTFRDEGRLRGAALNRYGLRMGSMGAVIGDPDLDGDIDLLVTNLVTEGATLYANDGAGSFVDVTRDRAVEAPTQRHTGWGVVMADFEHDGDEDLAIVNGAVVPGGGGFPPHGEDVFQPVRGHITNTRKFWADYEEPNLLLMNDGKGMFADASRAAGDFCRTKASGRGLICGDVDNDGDLDLVVTNVADRARLYRNVATKLGHWLMVQAVDPRLKRDAIGAEITVQVGSKKHFRILAPYSSYLASNDSRVHFGLGRMAGYDHIEVRWPDGLVERFPGGEADRAVRLTRGSGEPVSGP